MFRKILQPFYTTYVVLVFLGTLLLAFPIYLMLSIPNNMRCRKLMWLLTRYWSRVWLWLVAMPLKQYGRIPKQGKFVVVANHVSYLDPILIFDLLPWYFKPLAKREIAKAPIFGFIYGQLALMVDRSNIQTRAKSMRMMWRTLQEECSIFLYPEGTFNESDEPMKSFYDGAFNLAINAGVPILPILFPDTKARWHYNKWWKIWPGKNRAYILNPISVAGFTIKEVALLKENVRNVMIDAMREIQTN